LKLYRVGYRVNDVYGDYLEMGLPATLTREQVRRLAEKNDGRPASAARVQVTAGQTFTRDLPLRENDVYLMTLSR
jgi:xylan 1,4-beta-xylosidase